MRKFNTQIDSLEPRRLLSAIIRVDANSTAINPDGASWATAYADLQQALAVATFGDEIRVADGTYKPTSGTDRTISFNLKDGVSIFGGYAGLGAADPDQREIAAFPSVLSGDIGAANNISDNSFHVATGIALSDATVFDGLSFTKGNADGSTNGEPFLISGPGLWSAEAARQSPIPRSPTTQRCSQGR